MSSSDLLLRRLPLSQRARDELFGEVVREAIRRHGRPSYTAYGQVKAGIECTAPEVIIEGPADTGKTLGWLNKIHNTAQTYSNASLVILRKKQTDAYSTVLETFKNKVLGLDQSKWPCIPYGGERPSWFQYPNGSRIWITGLYAASTSQIAGKVLSGEHDLIYVNQAEEVGLPDWETLTTRTTGRAGHIPYPQTVGDCNPSSPTHWILTRERQGTLSVFKSSHRDNPELYDPDTGEITAVGEKRIGRLRALSGTRYQRLFLGLWAAPEGAIYDVFEEDKHKVKAFEVPRLWPRVVGIDPVGAYIGAVWLAFDARASVLNCYREYYGPFGETTPGHVKKMLELSRGETIFAWVGGGPSERQQRADFQGAGIPLLAPTITGVWPGIDRVYQLLKDFALVIHESCPQLLSEIGDYRRTMKDGIPTENIERKDEFHLLDALRYAVSYLTEPQVTEQVVYNPARIGERW